MSEKKNNMEPMKIQIISGKMKPNKLGGKKSFIIPYITRA
jgi:hypothetical protein